MHRQTRESAVQLIPDGNRRLRVRDCGVVDRKERNLHDTPPPLMARGSVAGPDDEPMEPGVEAVGVPKAPDVEPGSDERILDGVLRPVIVANDEPG